MKILLIDADSKIPNLALMKLSTYHKNNNDTVELIQANISYYPSRRKTVIIDAGKFDKVYVSIIFENTSKYLKIMNNDNVLIGGVGYNLSVKLDNYINELPPDYSIYPNNDISYGFITRGCIRKCYFCKVPKSEGELFFNTHPKNIVVHKKVKFMDNNFLAYDKHEEILKWLIENNIKFQFNQGLDIRLLNESNAKLLSKCNYLGEYTFAFDNINYEKIITEKIYILKKYIKKDWGIKIFLYCNSDMKLSDVIYRIDWCYDKSILPYLMRDINCWDSEYSDFYIDLCAWCNQPSLFKKMSFKKYISKRQKKNLNRQKTSMMLYYNNGGIH